VKDQKARPERVKGQEAALILGLSVRTIQNMAARGELPGAARIGKLCTFNEAKLRQFILDKEREIERQAANTRRTFNLREPILSERRVEKAYEEAMARLMGKRR
jgi:excisionase family DNA binding protein